MAATIKRTPQKSQLSDECMMASPLSNDSSSDSEVNSRVPEEEPKSTAESSSQRKEVDPHGEKSQTLSNESDLSVEPSQLCEVNWQIRKRQPGLKMVEVRADLSSLRDPGLKKELNRSSPKRKEVTVDKSKSQRHDQDDSSSQIISQPSKKGKSLMFDQDQQVDLILGGCQGQSFPGKEKMIVEQSQPSRKGKEKMTDQSQTTACYLQNGTEVADEESQLPGFHLERRPSQRSSDGGNIVIEQSQPSRKGKEKMVDQSQPPACYSREGKEVLDEESQLAVLNLNMSPSQPSSDKENILAEQSQPSRMGKEVVNALSELTACFSQKGKEVMEEESQPLGFHLERRPGQPSSSGKDMVDEFSRELEIKLQHWIEEYNSYGDLGQIMEHQLQILLSDFLSKKMESTEEEVNYEELFSQLSIKGKEMLDYVRQQSLTTVNSQCWRKSALLNQSSLEDMALCLAAYWRSQRREANESIDLGVLEMPLTFINGVLGKFMGMNFPRDTLLVCARACGMFVGDLTLRAWCHAAQEDRRMVTKSDVVDAVAVTPELEFLRLVMPREEGSDVEEIDLPVANGPRLAAAAMAAGRQTGMLPLLLSRFASPGNSPLEEDVKAEESVSE